MPSRIREALQAEAERLRKISTDVELAGLQRSKRPGRVDDWAAGGTAAATRGRSRCAELVIRSSASSRTPTANDATSTRTLIGERRHEFAPALRILPYGGNLDAGGHSTAEASRPNHYPHPLDRCAARESWMSISRPRSAASVAATTRRAPCRRCAKRKHAFVTIAI